MLAAAVWNGPVFCGEIHVAAEKGDLENVNSLIKENAGLVFSKDDNGATPLHYAAQNGHKEVAALLLANKADVNAKAGNGKTPLHFASQEGRKDVAALLLANKADVNARANSGGTPLHYAAQNGHKEVAALLLANKANVNARAKNGGSPLHQAAFWGRKDVAEVLLRNKAVVNARDRDGATPLHYAVQKGHEDVVALLLANKADVKAKNNDGATPLEIAVAHEDKGIMELLSQDDSRPGSGSEDGREVAGNAAVAKITIRQAQEELERLGYGPGPVDGVMGPKTTTALKNFQSDHGLPDTGTVDEKTAELFASQIEEMDWADAIKQDTVEAYLAYRTKYPTTWRVRVLRGEVSSRFRMVDSAPVWGVCVNGELVADGLSTNEIIRLRLAEEGDAQEKEARSARSMGLLRITVRGRSVSVKTIPNGNVILKNIDRSWKVVAVTPPS